MSSNLKNRMFQWESNPPGNSWSKIVATLDADEDVAFLQKLSLFESQPPAHVWQNIEAGLPERQPGKVISFNWRLKPAIRYGNAAAILVFISVLITLLVKNNHNKPNELALQTNIKTHQVPNTNETKANTADDQPLVHSPMATAPQPNNSIKPSAKRTGKKPTITAPEPEDEAEAPQESRYFVHTNENGEEVRLSNKLYGLFKCSEEWTENECDQQIKLWQQKVVHSSMLSSSDFTGVLEVLKDIQER